MAAHAICFDFYYCRQPSIMAALPAKAFANIRPCCSAVLKPMKSLILYNLCTVFPKLYILLKENFSKSFVET